MLLEHLMFQFAPSALDEAALAGRREEDNPKISVQLPNLCLPLLWQQLQPACLHPCKCGFPLSFPLTSLRGSLGAPGSSWAQELPPSPRAGQPLPTG